MRLKETALDRLVGYFAPQSAIRRAQARLALDAARSYEGAAKGRRTKNWRATGSSANAAISLSIETLIARSRQLAQDNPWAGRAVGVIASNTVGTGIIPQTKHENPALVERLERLWIDWADEVAIDADARHDFYGLQSLVLKTVVKSGSCLVRRRRRRPGDGLAVPMQLQVLEPDYLDPRKDGKVAGTTNYIIRGIEFDAIGRRVAYHLFKDHPGNNGLLSLSLESSRIPATEILHIYRVDRPGQVTGVPWAAPVLLRIRDLDEFEDAELVRQKVAACFAAFIHDDEPPENLGVPGSQTDDQKQRQDFIERLEPGAIEWLPDGKRVTFGQPPQTQGYDAHTRSVLRAIAAGYGVSYEALTGDMTQVNFSSGRMGWLEFQRNIDEWRTQMLIPQFCKPVWRWFVETAIIAGQVKQFAPATWTPPRREMIDPTKETAAMKDQVRSGFKSWSQSIMESGRDPEEVAKELAADYKKFDELGLMLDCDPRKRTSIGYSPNDTKPTNVAEKDPVDDTEN